MFVSVGVPRGQRSVVRGHLFDLALDHAMKLIHQLCFLFTGAVLSVRTHTHTHYKVSVRV